MVGVGRLLAATAVLGLAHLAAASSRDQQQVPLSADEASSSFTCTHAAYRVHVVSRSPLVLYLEGFLTADERAHLQRLAQGQFRHSGVVGAEGDAALHSVRTSQSTLVERDAVVRCIEQRALALQGFDTSDAHLEPIQLVRYGPGQRYHFHTDWFTDPALATAAQGGNRASSIFGYVRVDKVTGGDTNFPMLDAPRDERWCRFVACDAEYDESNAIYWNNMLDVGRGDQRTLHAGLPVVSGEKIGMNIWTREAPLPPGIRGE